MGVSMSILIFAPADPNEWVPKLRSSLRRMMRTWGSPQEVEDLIAEGIASAFTASRDAHDSLPFPLLITIGQRGAIDYLRRTKRPKRGMANTSNDPLTYAVQFQDNFAEVAMSDDGNLSRIETRRCLDSISATLESRERLIFNRLRDGVSQKDIATELGVSQARTSQLVLRMMQRLRDGQPEGNHP